MVKNSPNRHPTHIREWRKYRRLSLRQLAESINAGLTEPLISYASLQRIERGLQPYSQDTLEAIAAALNTEPAWLISRLPTDISPVDAIWAKLDPQQRRLAVALLQALIDAG